MKCNNTIPSHTETEHSSNYEQILTKTTQEIYDRMAQNYDTMHAQLREKEKMHWDAIYKYMLEKEFQNPIRVLEAGCGNGKDIQYARENFGYESIGIDFSENFINIARENNPCVPENEIIVADIRNLPFENQSFDMVRQYASMVHMPEGEIVENAMKETYRVLRPGGIIFILLRYGEGQEYIDTKEGLPPRFFQLYNIEKLGVLLTKHGFFIEQMEDFIGDNDKHWVYALAKK